MQLDIEFIFMKKGGRFQNTSRSHLGGK